jgi:diguanylate cyclase (GGDEF)-like protein
VALTWNTAGPREEERALAGKLAGVLWLTVPPMLAVCLLLPGSVTRHWELLAVLTIPALVWGLTCLLWVRWDELRSPLFFHVPAVIALPYIAVLVASSGVTRSPYVLTLLMLLAFCAYFFSPRAAIAYLVGCIAVHALPLVYDAHAVDAGLLGELWVAVFVYAAVGGVIIVGKNQLLSLREAADELSRRDSLTGLANRRALTELFAREEGGARRQDKVGLLLVDLDDFKEINTMHGLPGGDRALCAVADALRGISRSSDVVARLGGDEFAIFLHGVDQLGMQALARRALEAVREAGTGTALAGLELTASAGWALSPQDADSVAELVTIADLSLRAAKLNGKNCAQSPLDWATGKPEFV